jgi:hypothetical protein
MRSARNKGAQAPCFFAGAALQFLIAQVLFLAQLGSDHILLIYRKPFRLGDLEQLLHIERLLQTRPQMGLLARMDQKGIELFERQKMT